MVSSDLLGATSMLPKVLSASVLGTGSVDLVAPAANHASVIKSAVACNTTVNTVSLTVTITKSGGGAITVVSAYPILAGDSTVLTELVGAMLGPGDKISALASAGASVSLVITGTDNS